MKLTPVIILLGLFISQNLSGQQHNSFYQSLVNQVSAENVENNLTEFVNFGEKQMGSNSANSTFNWLIDKYESWGYTNIEQHQVSAFGESGYNLIVTKTGTVYPDTYIIIDGHYDTIEGPGANDNGSGTTVLLEIARILKDIPTEYSIKFIHFTAEEWGLIGSEQYVEDVVIPQDLDIRLVLNIDQVGGVAGESNTGITCERDEDFPNSNNNASADFTNQLMACMELYSNLESHLSYAYGSDYVPFQEAGYVITGLYEYNESPYTHSSQDTLNNVDLEFIYQVTKGALGAMCHFAKAFDDMGAEDHNLGLIQVYPNPSDKSLTVKTPVTNSQKIQIKDLAGKLIYTSDFSTNTHSIDVSALPNGVYLLHYSNGNSVANQKIIVQH